MPTDEVGSAVARLLTVGDDATSLDSPWPVLVDFGGCPPRPP
jgi:hypothetical protein